MEKKSLSRAIKITEVDNKYIVKIGCQDYSFETLDELMEKLRAFLENPTKHFREYLQGK